MERYANKAIEILNELHRERLDYKSEYIPLIDAAQRLEDYEETGLEPQEIERIVDAYGRCQTLRTESAKRLEIIREIPTEKLQDIAKQYRMSKLAKPYRYGKFE